MKFSLAEIRKLDWGLLAYARLKLGTFSILPYRGSYIRLGKGAQTSGAGQLHLGKQWAAGRPMPSQLVMHPGSKLHLEERFTIYSGHSVWVNENAELSLGSGYINNGLNLSCFKSIRIGHAVVISENVTIRDSDNHQLGIGHSTLPIEIGDRVWIGVNVTVLKGVRIGDGAVVAAGAVVTRDVPANTLVAGVPATVKKEGVQWK